MSKFFSTFPAEKLRSERRNFDIIRSSMKREAPPLSSSTTAHTFHLLCSFGSSFFDLLNILRSIEEDRLFS